MGKYALKIDVKRLAFEDEFISDNTIWRECGTNEDLFDVEHFSRLLSQNCLLIHC